MKASYANKRIAAFLLAICMTLSMLPVHAGAQVMPLDSGGEMMDSGPIPDLDLPESSLGASKLGGIGPQAAANGYALGIDGTDYITITLLSGAFAAADSISHTQFSLSSSGGQSILALHRDSDSKIRLSLDADIGGAHDLSVTADQDAFAEGTETFGTLTVFHGVQATGTATAAAGSKEITVNLTKGRFKASQLESYWTLGGSSAGANSIHAAAYVGEQTATITLTNNIASGDQYTLTASQSAFFNAAIVPFVSPLTVAVTPSAAAGCQIGSEWYPDLDEALKEVRSGETIQLLGDTTYESGIILRDKSFIIDVNDSTLTVKTVDDNGIHSTFGYSLSVVDNGAAKAGGLIVEASGERLSGLYANGNGSKISIEVPATVTVRADNSKGVFASSGGEIYLNGDVTIDGDALSHGAYAESSLQGGIITIDGTITALGGANMIRVNLIAFSDLTQGVSGERTGYLAFRSPGDTADPKSTVWVKKSAADTTPLAVPTGLDWDTAAPGNIKAKWNAVAGAQRYAIMLYKNGSPVGPLETNATSIYLTQYIQNSGTGSYTFTVRALAPSGSAEYTDSATSSHSPVYSYTAPAAVPAEGNAWATLYTKSIFVRLSQGGFKAVQNKVYWTLGEDGASGNSIAGVTFIDNTEVQITLTNDINSLDALTITADQDAFANGTAPFTDPLAVRLDPPQTYVCTIDGAAYPSLKSALAFALAPTVDNKTIVLAADIRYEERVVVEGKTLTFDLNGKNLVIDTSGTVTGDWHTASALKVDNGSVRYTGEGKFTVCGERRGVEAINGGRARVSEIFITNPGQPYPGHYYVYGAHARYQNSEGEGSQITVTGGIRTLSGTPCNYAIGALAGQDSTVTVGGNIHLEGKNVIGLSAGSMNDGNGTATVQNVTVTGESATGVKAAGESTATVNGAVTAAGAYAVGVSAELAENNSGGTVIVKGDAAATGANSTGVACFSSASATAKSRVTVDGTVSGENDLSIDNVSREKEAKDSVSGGYWIYNGQYESVVKVKDPDGGTPGQNVPTAPENLTATPGNGRVTLSWTAPTSTGDSAITGYQVSGDGGASWTNVGLTTSYTFIGLTNGTEYTFKVRAVNSAGSGAQASRTATPTAAPSVPTVPRNFTASPGFARVVLNWDVPMSNGGSAITRYEVSKNNGADWTSAGLTTSYEFTGLTNGTEYTFKVRAVNSAGNGAQASASAMPSDSAQTGFTVKFYSNGALYTSRSVMNGSALGGSWPANPTRSSYTFGGWFTGENGAGTRYTSASLITSNVDLYAGWNYSGGGSSGNGSGGGAPALTSAAAAAAPQWLEQSQTAGPIADAKENGRGYALTRANGRYGVRADAWPTFAGYQYWHDTMDGDAVQVRVCVKNPAAVTTDLLLSGYVKGPEAERVKSLFEKSFSNNLRTIHLDQTGEWGQPVEIAAKVDLAGMDVTKLVLYSYDSATNTYRRIEAPDYWVDEKGYLHFTTPYAGDIIISEGPLARI